MTDLATLARETEAAERRAVALRKFLEVAQELGEEGLAEVMALVAPAQAETEYHATHGTIKFRVVAGDSDQPSGREAVRRIVADRPGVWTLAELKEEMVARGWFTSDKGLEAACSRLSRLNGEARRIRKGTYVFPADWQPDEFIPGLGKEGAIESPASDAAMIAHTA